MRTRHARRFVAVALTGLLVLLPQAFAVGAATNTYQAGFQSWRAADGDFAAAAWTKSGVTVDGAGALTMDGSALPGTDPYPAGGYYGGNFYNGGSFVVGEATGPEVTTAFASTEAIASWNADTPAGTWIETLLRVRIGIRLTKWYSMGVWASGTDTIQRHSVSSQGDADGYVAVDTLVMGKKIVPDAYQVKVRLFSVDGVASPTVRNIGVAFSSAIPKKAAASPGNPANWGTLLNVPECSQMVYPDGGNVWCSPTSTSMVLGFWGIDPGPCGPRVKAAVDGTYDWRYDGHGNWPFNTAYAASRQLGSGVGVEAYVRRFTSLAEVEPWVTAGVPVVISFAWRKNDLTGAAVPSSSGHLAVIVGFDADGNPIVNDPAAASDEDVQRTYLRSEIERLWLQNSGGLVYLIYPSDSIVPSL